MPAVSIDTFFACSLMVIAVLSAMAGTSKLISPYVNNRLDQNMADRYREISKYILLNSGKPSGWGQDGQVIPESFGLAKSGSAYAYDLDVDKVSRLNGENLYRISYADMFSALGLSDVSFRLEIKPIFDVTVNLTNTFLEANQTVYEFEIQTEKNGAPVQTMLRSYVIAEDYLNVTSLVSSEGRIYQNVTVPESISGPAVLAVFARSVYGASIVSFQTYRFAHNASEVKPAGTFVTLGPLNYTLHASLRSSSVNVSSVYALSFDYDRTAAALSSDNESASYEIPRFVEPSPLILVLTGRNASESFVEYVSYPQIPSQTGADFAGSTSLSSVFAYTYAVTISSAVYECTMWLGGPRE